MASAVEQGKNKKWHMFRVGQNYGPTAKTISQLQKTISLKITNSMPQLVIIMAQFSCQNPERRKSEAMNIESYL